ncbi:MAG: universal stress protein [Rubripirellula sp.]
MRVLLATDGSKCSEEAAWFLSRLPHQGQLDLTILTVLSPPVTSFYSPTKDLMTELIKEDRVYAEQRQRTIIEMFEGANANVECRIVEGDSRESIVDYAAQCKSDLVVLGAKGHSQIDRILLGSTSDYVATQAPCSVLVVRPTGLREQLDRSLRVTVAFDDSAASHAALDELMQFQWGSQTEITVVGVASFAPVFNPDFGFNPEALQQEAKKVVEVAAERLQGQVREVQTEVVEHDHIAEGLVRYTEKEKSDLLVIGDTGRSALARSILGSVSRYTLRHASCGVWISRHAGDAKSSEPRVG